MQPKLSTHEEFRTKPIQAVTTDIRPSSGLLPTDSAAERFAQQGILADNAGVIRPWVSSDFSWEASALCHGPLYFEEIDLERHGYKVRCLQPLVSAASFYGRIPALPYLMAVDRCTYTLGHYRPGSEAPCRTQRVPVLLGPSLVEAAVITGLVFAIP